jgi:hypothetical protein
MRIISFIEDDEVIEKILKHLGLWNLKVRPRPKVKAPSVTVSIDNSDSQIPFSALPFYPDPNYPMGSTGFQNRPWGLRGLLFLLYIFFFRYFKKATI